VLQNRGAYFSLDPAHPNCLAPGKIPMHTLIASVGKRVVQLKESKPGLVFQAAHPTDKGPLSPVPTWPDFCISELTIAAQANTKCTAQPGQRIQLRGPARATAKTSEAGKCGSRPTVRALYDVIAARKLRLSFGKPYRSELACRASFGTGTKTGSYQLFAAHPANKPSY
jgi:hypothetical protein